MRSRTFGCEPDEGEENASKLGVAVVATFSDDYQAAIGHEGSFDHRAARTFRRPRCLQFGVIVLSAQIMAVVTRRAACSKARQFGGFRTIGGFASH
jgi:hypothetical protein